MRIDLLTLTQLACMTKLTREGVRDMTNRKPYRTKAQKKKARESAQKTAGGFYVSDVPASYHKRA